MEKHWATNSLTFLPDAMVVIPVFHRRWFYSSFDGSPGGDGPRWCILAWSSCMTFLFPEIMMKSTKFAVAVDNQVAR